MKNLSLAILFAMLLSIPAHSQSASPVTFLNPSSIATPKGYSQAVRIDLGNSVMLIISGQVPLDKQGNLVGKGDFAAQADQVFNNLKNIIEEQGGSMKDLVKLGVYLTDISNLTSYRDAKNKYTDLTHPPASTLVQVVRLYRDDIMLEVEATAVIPRK